MEAKQKSMEEEIASTEYEEDDLVDVECLECGSALTYFHSGFGKFYCGDCGCIWSLDEEYDSEDSWMEM